MVKEMKIWVVYVDGELEYGSTDLCDVYVRFVKLLNGFGEDRVVMKLVVCVKGVLIDG